MAAERNNHTSVIQLLLHHGADPDCTDSLGMKPIDYATVNEKHRVVTFLTGE
jgi:ankyrin repeat protein